MSSTINPSNSAKWRNLCGHWNSPSSPLKISALGAASTTTFLYPFTSQATALLPFPSHSINIESSGVHLSPHNIGEPRASNCRQQSKKKRLTSQPPRTKKRGRRYRRPHASWDGRGLPAAPPGEGTARSGGANCRMHYSSIKTTGANG